MAFCGSCGAQLADAGRFCAKCGAPKGAINGEQAAAPPAAPGVAPAAAPAVAPQPVAAPPAAPGAYQGTYAGAVPGAYQNVYPGAAAPPPGMVPVMYQAYPGGPQQMYYVPAQGVQAQGGVGLMEGLRSRIRNLASTDKLEGFSLKDLFKDTFSRHGSDEVEDYLAVGSPRSTPPLELVNTNWPTPWMFFRVLAGLAVAYAAYYWLYLYSTNEKVMIGTMVIATFAMPMATLMLIWEMNTPHNVSIVEVIKLFVVAGGLSVVIITLWYLIPVFGNVPGIVEETSKLLAVIIVTYGARGARYPYQLNGILFGATVGAAYACSETLGYAMDVFGPGLVQFVKSGGVDQLLAQNPNGVSWGIILMPVMKATIANLNLRGLESPLGHIVWTAISAGAFWRVKGDRTASLSMLLDKRFLRAFMIPVLMHTTWDAGVIFPNINPTLAACLPFVTGAISWYVLFTMIQQGLHQVRDMQKAQLESTLHHAEATLGLGARSPFAMQPQAAGAQPQG